MTRIRGKAILFAILGGAAGFAYYWFIGCTTGACPITSSPYVSTIYGGVMGLLVSGTAGNAKPKT
jgi:hypothetical protein